jgi:hypothetical protein
MLRFDLNVRLGDLIALAAVIVAFFALQAQWGSVHLAQQNVQTQLTTLRDLTNQLSKETDSRKASEDYFDRHLLTHARDLLELQRSQADTDSANHLENTLFQRYFSTCFVALASLLDSQEQLRPEDSKLLHTSLIDANGAMIELSEISAEYASASKAVLDKQRSEIQQLTINELGYAEYFRRTDGGDCTKRKIKYV